MVVDAKHRPLVKAPQFFARVRHPAYRLLVRALAPFPHLTSKREWKLTRGREAADVNLEVREAVDRDGHSLVKIALSMSEIPK